MTKNLYLLNTYTSVIKLKMGENIEQWGLVSKMAKAADCQRSHLSRVLKGSSHLTLEQAAGLASFFVMSETESEYFLALVELERAGTPALKARFQKRIQRIRQEQENISTRLQISSLGVDTQELTYYSAWQWIAVHIIVSIPAFQTIPAISKRLSLPEDQVTQCLETLAEFGLVKKQASKWVFASQSVHLPKSSPLISIHHGNWRSRSVLASQNPKTDGVHYTVVQSLSLEDYKRVKQLILETIETFSKVAGPSKEEELICFTCDLDRV
jgi:uncharacterized protein (TIGR02147 family)